MSTPPSPTPIMQHGGDLGAAATAFGIPVDDWLDLSTGINPVAYPIDALSERAWHRLPQSEALERLLATARTAYGVADHLDIIATPGTQAAIQWLPIALGAQGQVAVRTPTYTEHAAAWRIASCDIVEAADLETLLGHAIAVIVNPNNPDGTRVPPQRILDMWRNNADCRLLVIDEAFADCDPEISAIPHIRDEPVAVLRSFGKFFGLAGLRLGFVVARPHLIADLTRLIGPWAVSGPALDIGAAALADKDWIEQTRQDLLSDQAKLDAILRQEGLEPKGRVPLFRLVEHPDAQDIHRRLCKAGIWTRVFAFNPHWLRVGLPRSNVDRARLADALAQC